MFHADALAGLVSLLERRRVYLYHACQLQDFGSYLRIGGVPSRARLEQERLAVTPFMTDGMDRANGVWDKVFVNWEDFGNGFARGRAAVPNPYGPILLRLKPRALLEAVDVAICLQSAGSAGFNRERESVRTLDEANRLFYDELGQGPRPAALKFKSRLRQEYGPSAHAVEVSCTFGGGVLPLKYLIDVVVDPYFIGSATLAESVQNVACSLGHDLQVDVRSSGVGEDMYQSLLEAIEKRTPSLSELAEHSTQRGLGEWAARVAQGTPLLQKNFRRYAQYLRAGTIAAAATASVASPPPLPKPRPIGIAVPREEEELDTPEPYDSGDELDLILEERHEYRADWARSNEDGWFYNDEDNDEWDVDEDGSGLDDESGDGWDEDDDEEEP